MLEADLRRTDVVGDDQVEVLAAELGCRIGHHIAGLGGEADQVCPGRLLAPSAGEDVGRRLEDDLGHAGVLLDLAGLGSLRAGSRRPQRPSR